MVQRRFAEIRVSLVALSCSRSARRRRRRVRRCSSTPAVASSPRRRRSRRRSRFRARAPSTRRPRLVAKGRPYIWSCSTSPWRPRSVVSRASRRHARRARARIRYARRGRPPPTLRRADVRPPTVPSRPLVRPEPHHSIGGLNVAARHERRGGACADAIPNVADPDHQVSRRRVSRRRGGASHSVRARPDTATRGAGRAGAAATIVGVARF